MAPRGPQEASSSSCSSSSSTSHLSVPPRVSTTAGETHSPLAWPDGGPTFGHIGVSKRAGGGGGSPSASSSCRPLLIYHKGPQRAKCLHVLALPKGSHRRRPPGIFPKPGRQGPNRFQDGQDGLQGASTTAKTAPREPKMAPRWPQGAQDDAKMAQHRPR